MNYHYILSREFSSIPLNFQSIFSHWFSFSILRWIFILFPQMSDESRFFQGEFEVMENLLTKVEDVYKRREETAFALKR